MVYLDSLNLNQNEQVEYEKICIETQPKVKTEFNGKGLLNEYFSKILNREGKASR